MTAARAAWSCLHQTLIDDLQGASDNDFDKRYVSQQVAAHKNAIALFSNYRDHGDDDGLRSLASSALPILQHHMTMAEQLSGRA